MCNLTLVTVETATIAELEKELGESEETTQHEITIDLRDACRNMIAVRDSQLL
jgi:hypothetical protein